MAFPVTIEANLSVEEGGGGPYLSSAGNVYVIARQTTAGSDHNLRAYKATDPSSSFAFLAGVALTSSELIRAIASCQVGDNIHVVTMDGDALSLVNIRYHVFSMSSDTWTTSNEAIKTAFNCTGSAVSPDSSIGIAVRSDGSVVVSYFGAKAAVMGSDYSRAAYAIRASGGGWTIDLALGGTGSSNWGPGAIVLGSSDRCHMFCMDATANDVYQQTLTSANSLQTLPASFDANTPTQFGHVRFRGTTYASGGTTKVRIPYLDAGGTIGAAQLDSSDTPTTTAANDITGAVDALYGSMSTDGTTVWHAFRELSPNAGDIYTQSSSDGGAWSTPSLFSSAPTAYGLILTSIYTRGGNVVLGMLYQDNGVKYTEHTISAGGTAVGQDQGGSYAISAAVGANSAGSYAIAATVGQDSAGSYAVLNAAGQDQGGTYAVIEAVGANHAGSYGIGGTVSADHAGTYAIIEAVGQDRTGSYAVLSAVGQDQAGSYGVIESVGQSQAGSYGIVAAVGADGSGSYAVHAAVGQDSAGSYAIAEAVGADLAGTYGIVSAVSADHAGSYAIAEVVGQDQPGAYGIAEAVQSDHAGTYAVVEAVGQDQSGGWAIVEVVGQSLAGAYNIEATGAVGNDLAGSYGIAESVGADCAGSYGVVDAVGQDQAGAYGVVEAVGADQAGAYAVAAVVGEDMPGTYGIAQAVGQDQAGAYAVLVEAGADQEGAYAIVGAVGANLAGSYVIDGTTSATLYFVSHVTGNVSTPNNALGAPDGVFTTDANTQTNWTSRWRLDTVAGSNQPNGTQSITLRMRKGSNSGNPTVSSVTLYQGGVSLGALTLTSGSTTISSTTGQDLVYEFSGSLLAGMVDVDIEIATAGAGGTPGQRNAASIDAGTWAAAYQVVQAVGADLSGGYAIAQAVGQDQPGAYAVIASVGADLSAGYAVVEAVGQDQAGEYSIVHAVGQDQAGAYAVIEAAGSDLAGAYGVIEAVGQDLAGTYSVGEGLTAVGNDLAQAYEILEAVGAENAGAYGITGQVGQDIAGSYGITATVTSDQPGEYRVLVSVASDAEGGYSVFEVAGADLVQAYAVAAQVASDLAGGYAVEGSGAPAPFSAIEARINRAMFALLSDTEATLDGAAVTGIFEDGYAHGSAGAIGMADTQPVFIVPTASITGEAVGQLLVANSQTYIVGAHEPDGTGVSRLILERAS